MFHLLLAFSVTAGAASVEERAQKLLDFHSSQIQPLEKRLNLAWWDANTSGKDTDYEKKALAQNAFDEKLSSPEYFSEIKSVRDALKKSRPSDLKRQIELLYLVTQEKQVPTDLLKEMTSKANAIEQVFNVTRAKVGAKEFSDSEVKQILKASLDSKQRQGVWEASKQVGALVEKDLKELVSLRNQAAKHLGYANFHSMQLQLNEQEPEKILGLFDELDRLTRAPFLKAKEEIDTKLAKMYHLKKVELMPWHYQDPFFQDAPSVFEANLDETYKKLDVISLCERFYAGIGLPIDDVIKRSDLYERNGKSPHAFCTDIDRAGDVRVLANVVPNEQWMSTMLHELGHSVYSSKNIPASLPYLLRTDAHILATEGVAMLFQKFSKSAEWLQQMGVEVADPKVFSRVGKKLQQVDLLVFSRWAQVMFRFEKGLYENPSQDLNALWWGLVEKYQGLKKPSGRNAPDYAAKIHVVVAPAYYHNYLLGQLFASQVHHAVARDVLKTSPDKAEYAGNTKVGDFFRAKVFGPGRSMQWNELTRFATGQPLNAKAFAWDLTH